MIAYLREWWKKEAGCEARAKRMDDLLVNIDVLISNIFQGTNGSVSWKSIAFMVAAGADRVQSMPENMVSKYVMSSFGIEILINEITVNNQWEKQITLQVVQKISYLLEGNLTASDRTPECLWSHWGWGCQAKTTAQSGLVESCSKEKTFTTWTVCLQVFLITCIPDEFFFKKWVKRSEKVLSSIDIERASWHWVWGEHCGETAKGGDDFHGATCCANKVMRVFMGFMRIVG